jgi:two-component system OmpR family response regulator
LRRADHTQGGQAHRVAVYVFAGWRLDVASRQLRNSAGVVVELNGAEFELLALLLADAKRVWSRLELSQQLHGRDNDPLDRSIDVRISRLRQKLGDPARSPTILKTVYGGGYVMGVPVVVE